MINRFSYASPLILQTLIWLPTRLILLLFARFEVRGLENLEALETFRKNSKKDETLGNIKAKDIRHGAKGVIFASNHSSEIDPIILPAGLPFLSSFMPIFYTSREKKFYDESGIMQIIYGGRLFKLWGAYPVYTGLKDYEKSLVNHIQLLNDGKSLMIFPEGSINRKGSGLSGEAKGGIGFLASETGCPIVPIGISGAYQMRWADFFARRRKITLTFGKPIFADELVNQFEDKDEVSKNESVETYKEIAQSLMEKVQPLIYSGVNDLKA